MFLRNFLKKRCDILEASILAILLFFTTQPYFIWPYIQFLVFVSLAISLFCLLQIDIKSSRRKLPFLILFIAYLILSIHRGAQIGGTLLYLSLSFIPYIKALLLKNTYKCFYVIIVFVFAISILSYISVGTGLQTPIGQIEPLNDIKNYNYLEYIFLVIPGHLTDLGRFCSVYDEPGVVGTISALILCIERFNLRKTGNIIIMVAGFLSFSLFFFLISAIFILYSLQNKHKLVFLLAVLALYYFTKDNDIANIYIWDRLELSDNGTISGDNRNSDALLDLWERSKMNPQILFGYGWDYVEDYTESASLQLFILRDGIIFVILYLWSYLFMAKNLLKSYRKCLLFFLIMFGTLYQRPGFCNADFTLLFSAYIIINYERNTSIRGCSKL